MGSYCSVLNDYDEPIFIKYSAKSLALKTAGFILAAGAIIGTAGTAAPAIIAGGLASTISTGMIFAGRALEANLRADGYTEIGPGGIYTSEKMTQSLLTQANIVRKKETGAEVGSMAVWTGVTADSTMEYKASDCGYKFQSYTK